MAKSIQDLIKARREKGISKKVVSKKWLYPTGIEREYHRVLNRLVNEIKERIKVYLLPEIPGMVKEVEVKTPNDRADGYLDRLQEILLFISRSLNDDVEQTQVAADVVGVQINRFNAQQFDKLKDQAFVVNPFVQEPWLADQLKLFSVQNAQLIKSLPDQELERVAGVVERGLQEGATYSTVAKNIQKSFGITRRRATLIARDQTKKLNSSLTKLRQQEVGVEFYTWQTSDDERVRASHRVLDGKLCRWDDPTVFQDPKTKKWVKKSSIGGDPVHVGVAVNCRCNAIADLSSILDLD